MPPPSTHSDVQQSPIRAHATVVPGGTAEKDASGNLFHEAVWRYLFTHPVEKTGQPVPPDPDGQMNQKP